MRLINYADGSGTSWGLVVDGGIVDMGRDSYAETPDISAAMTTSSLMDLAMISVGRRPTAALREVSLLSPLKAACVVTYTSPLDAGRAGSVTVRPLGTHSLAVPGDDLPAVTAGPVDVRVHIAALVAHVPDPLQGDLSEAVACLTPLVTITGQATAPSHANCDETLTIAGPAWVSRDEAPILGNGATFVVSDATGDGPLRRAEVTTEQLHEALHRSLAHTPLAPGDVVAIEGAAVSARVGSRLAIGIEVLGGFTIDFSDARINIGDAGGR